MAPWLYTVYTIHTWCTILCILATLPHTSLSAHEEEDEVEDDTGEVVDHHNPRHTNILMLNDKNFDAVLKLHDTVLVQFYAPWCGHCKALAPEWEKAAQLLAAAGSPIRLAMVDATTENVVATRNNIVGYPTVKLFRRRADEDGGGGGGGSYAVGFAGKRTGQGIVDWLAKMTSPLCEEISGGSGGDGRAAVEALVHDGRVVVVGYFPSGGNKEHRRMFETVAEADQVNKFVCLTTREARKEFFDTEEEGADKDKLAVGILRNFDTEWTVFPGGGEDGLDRDQLEKFIELESRPTVYEYDDETAKLIFGFGVFKHLLVFSGKSHPDYERHLSVMREVGKTLKEEIIFVHVNIDDPEYDKIVIYMEITKDECPTFVVFQLDRAIKFYPENKEISEANLRDFVTNYLEGNLKARVRSEEPAEDWEKQPVKVLVGKTFSEVAYDEGKDVFVIFHAPWCGVCKRLLTVWGELAKKFENRKDKVLAEIDSSANDVEGLDIETYPTLTLFKKKSNEAVRFRGNRTFETLSDFLEFGILPDNPFESVADEEGFYEEEDLVASLSQVEEEGEGEKRAVKEEL